MRSSRTLLVIVLLVGVGAGCSSDPEEVLRQQMEQGNSYMQSKKYSEAIVSFRNAVRADERSGEARMKLAEAYLAAGDGRNGLREAIRAADLMPDNVEAQLRSGLLLLLGKQYPEARTRAVAALAKEPQNPQALILLGNSLAGLKDIDGAIEQVEQAINEDPQLTLSYANLGALQLAKGDRDAAEDAFRKAIAAAPRSSDAHASLANFLWAAGDVAGAESEFKTALQLEPTSPAVNRAMATFYSSQNRADEAEPYLKAYAKDSGAGDAQFLLADYYVRSKRVSEATTILSGLAGDQGSFARASLRLATLDFVDGRRPQAYARIDDVVRREPRNEAAFRTRIRFLLSEGKNQEALAATGRLIEINPRSANNQFARSLALEATGSPDEAVKALREALAVAPASAPIQAKLSELLLSRGDVKTALALSEQVVKTQPQSTTARFLRAKALLRSGELVSAERELAAIEKVAPSAEVYTWTGMLHETKRDVRAARRSFERALQLDPESDIALAGLVSADLAEKNPSSALARIQTRLAKTPNDAALVMMSGMAYMAVRDFPKAEAAYRKLLELDPNNMDAYGRLGALYYSQNRLDEAKKSFEEIAQRPGTPVAAETMLGTILVRQNNPTEARKHFERALQLNPRAAVAANNLAWDYTTNGGNLDTALQLAQTAKAELPDNALVTDTLGWVYYQKGLSALAVATLKEAAAKGATNPDIHYHLGLAYLKNGNKPEARASLEHVLKLNPAFPAAADVRRALATIEG